MGIDLYDWFMMKFKPLVIYWLIIFMFCYVPKVIAEKEAMVKSIATSIQLINKQKEMLEACLPTADVQIARIGTDGQGGYICSITKIKKGITIVLHRRIFRHELMAINSN